MAFRVELRPRAEQDLETLFRQLVQVAPIRGPEWVNGMERAIASLREMPGRCPVVRQFSKGAVEVQRPDARKSLTEWCKGTIVR